MNPAYDQHKQHTLAAMAEISGVGLHSGIHADMKLKPRSPGFGFRFQRVDLPGQPVIAADCDLVSDTFRCTTLTDNGASIKTVEHVLAALVGSGIDNCLIEVNGPEIPNIDGSCQPFVQLIEKAGRAEQQAKKNWFSLDTEISDYYPEKNVKMMALPHEEYSIDTHMDFAGSLHPDQTASLDSIKNFKKEIAPCRTYCFIHELEMLIDKNLVRGDIVKNAILLIDKPVSETEMLRLKDRFNMMNFKLGEDGYLNNLDLRFENEIARHKLMDMIGDLALIGFPVKAKIFGSRPGHTTNVEFAKKVKQYILKKKAGKISAIRA